MTKESSMATPAATAHTKTTPKPAVTATMSEWAASLTFDQLSKEAVHQAKRFLLDSIGCALGGYQQHDVLIALEVLTEIAGQGKATVIGSGAQMDAVSASLANALMIRCMDYNDIYWKQDPSHPSDIFPAAIACCERAGADGRELIVGLVLGTSLRCGFAKLLSRAFASAAGTTPHSPPWSRPSSLDACCTSHPHRFSMPSVSAAARA
jgi:2-methylcitrate dehydratase PrpD